MKITIPTHCPCCSSLLEFINEQLFCKNSGCSAQLSKRLEHFCKTLQIKGLGPKTIEKLKIQDILELYFLDVEDIKQALGSEKLALKLVQEIENSKNSDLATVLASFSIPLVGTTISQKLSKHINTLDEISEQVCKQAGLGDKATQNIINWFQTEYQEIKEFLPFNFETKSTRCLDGETVCITGKLRSFKTKTEAYAALEALGYTIMESVTQATQYLVDEENKLSSKRKKAEQLNITIIEDLNEFIQRNKND